MGRKKTNPAPHIPHQLWNIACELEGLSVLLQNQGLSSQESLHFDQGLEGIGQILGRSAKRLRKYSRLVDELEVAMALKRNRKV